MRLIAVSILVSLCALGAMAQEARACDCYPPTSQLLWPTPDDAAAPTTQYIVLSADYDNDLSKVQVTANGQPTPIFSRERIDTLLGDDCTPGFEVLYFEEPLPANAEVLVSLPSGTAGDEVFRSNFTTTNTNSPTILPPSDAELFVFDVLEAKEECGLATVDSVFFFRFEAFSPSEPVFIELLDNNDTTIQRLPIMPPLSKEDIALVAPIDLTECVTFAVKDLEGTTLFSQQFCQADKCASGEDSQTLAARSGAFWEEVSIDSCSLPQIEEPADEGCATAPDGQSGTGALFVLAALLFWRRRP